MKKLLAVLLSVCLILGVCATSFAAGSKKAAKDPQKLLELLAYDDEDDAEEAIGSILEALLSEDESETADEAEGESFLGDIISKVNTGLAMYIMDKDAEDEGLNLIIAALISYWTKDAEPLRNAVKYAEENYDIPEEIHDGFIVLMDSLAGDIENIGDGYNSFPLNQAAALDYFFSEDAGFAILPAVISLAVHDEDPENEYEELGFWLLVHIALYLDYIEDDDDIILTNVLLGDLLDIAKSGNFEEVSKEEYEAFLKEHLVSERAEAILAHLLGLYDQ